jgi:FixJ family two-component response regulator
MVGANRHIVIIDDDPGMGHAIERLCRADHMSSRCFTSAEDYLGSGEIERTDVLVLDIHLPGMSGIELHEHLKTRGIHLPAVFITAHDSPRLRDRALAAGAAACFAKPFNGADLLDAIHQIHPAA